MTRLLTICAGAALLWAPFASAAENKKSSMSSDMRRAIAFQRAKDRADARQARLEARHPSVTYNNANRSAETDFDRSNKVKDPGEPAVKRDKK